MIEVTVSRKVKVNKGNYENEDLMAVVKAQAGDGANAYEELEKADKAVKLFVERKEKEIKKKLEETK